MTEKHDVKSWIGFHWHRVGSVKVMNFLVVSRHCVVRFESATAILIKIKVLWDVTPCVLIVRTKLNT
jgi:hypothetical protein